MKINIDDFEYENINEYTFTQIVYYYTVAFSQEKNVEMNDLFIWLGIKFSATFGGDESLIQKEMDKLPEENKKNYAIYMGGIMQITSGVILSKIISYYRIQTLLIRLMDEFKKKSN